MIEIRIHGRGGQGAVVASKMLVTAAAKEGKKVQAFPTFGAERRGGIIDGLRDGLVADQPPIPETAHPAGALYYLTRQGGPAPGAVA